MRKGIKIAFIALIIIFQVDVLAAQTDSIQIRYQKEFNNFKQSIERTHQQFKTENDSVFSRFLKDSWQEFDVFYNEKPPHPKPDIQPEFKTDSLTQPFQLQPAINSHDSLKHSSSGTGLQTPVSTGQPPSVNSWGHTFLNFSYYGVQAQAPHPGPLPPVAIINAQMIQAFFQATAALDVVSQMVQNLRQMQEKLKLNDWGYYQLVEQTAGALDVSPQQQTLLSWLLMLKSGYNVKTGFSNDRIYLLLPANEEIFLSYYLVIDETPFYIQTRDSGPLPSLQVHTAGYPGSRSLSMQINEIPSLGDESSMLTLQFMNQSITFHINNELIRFYADYPVCDMSTYFNAPLSDPIRASLEAYFNPILEGKSEKEKADILLRFVQSAFQYKTDTEQFGHEKYFFPDELFYYSGSDCEDRSVLFSKLVTLFTGTRCIALNFPGHVNTAVAFNDQVGGDFIELGTDRFVVCDPTWANAPVGYLDSRYKKHSPKIITLH